MTDLWERWEAHYDALGITGRPCRDGIVDERVFAEQTQRVLFVMKDTNQADGIDLCKFLREGPRYQMWHTTARWAAGILDGFPPFEKVDDWSVMNEALSKVAVINLKKTTGGPAADLAVVSAYAHQDRNLLVEQIDSISPTIIMACGTIIPLVWLLDLTVVPEQIGASPIADVAPNAWVIPWRHPARANNSRTYDRLKELMGPVLGVR